jgi:hypothetical protein
MSPKTREAVATYARYVRRAAKFASVIGLIFGAIWLVNVVPNPILPTLIVRGGDGIQIATAKVEFGNNVSAVLKNASPGEQEYGELRCNYYDGSNRIVSDEYTNWLAFPQGDYRKAFVDTMSTFGVRRIVCYVTGRAA